VNRIRSAITIIIICTFLLCACGPNAAQQEATNTAKTVAAIPPTVPPTNTSIPTATYTPLPTDTPTPVPTDTPTLVPTDTPLPTDTPTITPTPGPFSFFDDFTVNSGGWADCELCSWENGGLVVGPFPPTSNFHKYTCTGCGEATYYKIAVDANFLEGQVDRFFGVFVGDANGKQYYLGISPWQFYIVGQHSDAGDSWDVLDIQWSGAVKASYATNHFEVEVRPTTVPGTADIIFSLNGSSVYIVYNAPIQPSTVGVAMDWHAVTANYDNWEYTVIEP
jgi:hypothetical protein